MQRYSFAISKIVEKSPCCIVNWEYLTSTCKCIYSVLDKACQRFGAGIKNIYGRNRLSWSAVRVDAGKHVDFCRGFVLSTAEKSLLILRPTRHTGALLFHRVVSVSDGKPRSVSTILVFFGLDPAPPSFRHARPPKWC